MTQAHEQLLTAIARTFGRGRFATSTLLSAPGCQEAVRALQTSLGRPLSSMSLGRVLTAMAHNGAPLVRTRAEQSLWELREVPPAAN